MAMNPMDDARSAALAALPHGPEFRFLDRLVSLEPGKSGAGEYAIPRDAPFLRGHFPGRPIFPGVLLIEAAAQLAGCVAQSDPKRAPLANLKLTAIKGAKILGSAAPGQTIRLSAAIEARMEGLVQAAATAEVEGRIILQVQLTLSGRTAPAISSENVGHINLFNNSSEK
jgi:3-hydroxyacyl-[acyl-carrier-protein] dehydratase